jgi:hypothetical protein
MKKIIIITLCFVFIISGCISCSSGTSDASALYKEVIEQHLNALIQSDTDAYLSSLDPNGPFYPGPEAIQELRDTESEVTLIGEASVENLSVIEESANRAQVRATIFTRFDLHNTGEFTENTADFLFELTLVNGKWLIYSYTPD